MRLAKKRLSIRWSLILNWWLKQTERLHHWNNFRYLVYSSHSLLIFQFCYISTALILYIKGHIWRTGFEKKEIEGVVFEDVPKALKNWHSSNIKVSFCSHTHVNCISPIQALLFFFCSDFVNENLEIVTLYIAKLFSHSVENKCALLQ